MAITLLLPILVVVIGATWIFGMLEHYQRAAGHARQGLIGVHYSVPEWRMEYTRDGQRMEWWAFAVPAYTTLALLLLSAVVGSVVYIRLWIEAASEFI